jgi:hypothetical protein
MHDPTLMILILRMLERTLSVIISGVMIYYGYRLFTLIPTQSNSQGKIELPSMSVVFSKVGPGVFFAAFGSVVLFKSLQPITIGDHFLGASAVTGMSSLQIIPTPQRHEKTRQSIQMLNCMKYLVIEPRIGLRQDDVVGPVIAAKVALLDSIWNQEDWGNKREFLRWAQTTQGTIPESLRTLFNNELPGCPRQGGNS